MSTADSIDVALGESRTGPETPVLRIHAQQSVIDEIRDHTTSDTAVEQGGVLVGDIDQASGTLLIYGSVRAEGAEATNSSLTFTHDAWDHIEAEMAAHWPDQRIVGWYHSHPGFGIFLSEFDRFICDNFFSEPWQVAYVVDPISGDDGFFARSGGEMYRVADWDVCARMDTPRPERPVSEPVHRIEPAARPAAAPTSAQRLTPLAAAAGGLLVGALAFGVLFRPSPPRVEFAMPRISSQQLFVDAGSVAVGRDGTLYAGEPRSIRRVGTDGAVPLAEVNAGVSDPTAPPLTVADDGSVLYVDPATGELHRVTGPEDQVMAVTAPESVEGSGRPWSRVSSLAAGTRTVWVLDEEAPALWAAELPDRESPELSFDDPIPLVDGDGSPILGDAIAADGTDLWLLDRTAGRVYSLAGDRWEHVAGGGTVPPGTDGARAGDLDLTDAHSLAAVDGVVYVVTPAGIDPVDGATAGGPAAADGGDAGADEGEMTAGPVQIVRIATDGVSVVGQADCAGPLDAVTTATGPVVIVVPTCTGIAVSYVPSDDTAPAPPDATTPSGPEASASS